MRGARLVGAPISWNQKSPALAELLFGLMPLMPTFAARGEIKQSEAHPVAPGEFFAFADDDAPRRVADLIAYLELVGFGPESTEFAEQYRGLPFLLGDRKSTPAVLLNRSLGAGNGLSRGQE